jgi:GT2 family glycosyltransferase
LEHGIINVRLEPEKDVEEVDGGWQSTSVEPWLRLQFPDPLSGYRWVRLRYSASFFDDPVRPLIRFTRADGHISLQPMNGPVLGRGEWVGRVPPDTVSVSISPVSVAGRFDFRLDSIQRVGRQWLVRRGIAQDRDSLWMSVGAKVINAEQERWDLLKFAATSTPLNKYASWHERNWRPIDVEGIDRPRFDWSRGPFFNLFVALERGNVLGLNATFASLREQVYGRWRLHGLVSPTTPPEVLTAFRQAMTGDDRLREVQSKMPFSELLARFFGDDMMAVVGYGDGLPDYALAVMAEKFARAPDLRMIYGDEDALSTAGTLHSPVFKPDWSALFHAREPFIGRLTCIRCAEVARLGLASAAGFVDQEETNIKRLTALLDHREIGHARRVVYRRWRDLGTVPLTHADAPTAPAGDVAATHAATAHADQPEVSIVIPMRDRAHLLADCMNSLRKLTDYPRYNVVIVDNGSAEPDALALLKDLSSDEHVQVVESPGPFNFSALCNTGARATASPVLLFLNNDTVISERNWLTAMVKYATRADIGVVGAKLLFPDNRIEHAGVVIGHGGIAGHIYHRDLPSEGGYQDQLRLVREVSAVTGACFAIERSKFEAVGGFDAENLPVDLNDIDLCLRVSARGWTTVWTPESVLYHRQSASRGFQFKPTKVYRKERDYFLKQWSHIIRDDPYFHPALSLFAHKPALA